MKAHREHYTSIRQAVNRAESVSKPDLKHASRGDPPDAEWDFNAGWDGALELARNGWHDGAAKVSKLARDLLDAVDAKVMPLATQYGDAGGYGVDVARFLSGEPEHYLEFAEQPAPRAVTLTVNLTCSSGVRAEQAFRRGAVVLAAAEVLIARGFAVTIQAKVVNRSSAKKNRHVQAPVYVASFDVHKAGDALDVDAVAFTLCHPAFTRRIAFGLKEGAPAATRRELIQYRQGYATSYGIPTDEQADFESPLYEPMMWARSGDGNAHRYDTEASRVSRVLDLCEAAGADVRR
jgi:hypothetical protein